MAKVPAFAKAFAGRWRIVEMDVWDNDFLDLVESARPRCLFNNLLGNFSRAAPFQRPPIRCCPRCAGRDGSICPS